MRGNSLFHILWTFRPSLSPCPYGIVVVVFHFDSGGRKAKKNWRWQAGTILRFMGGSCDEILQAAEHWRMGTCSPGQGSMAAVHEGLCFFFAPFSASSGLLSKGPFYWSVSRLVKGGVQKAKSKPNSLGGGWQAAGAGGVEGCLGEHLAEGGFVSLHIGMVGAILGQQAGRECLHGSMTGQSGPAGDEGCREGCLQEGRCLSCFCLGKKFNKHESFFTPSSSGFGSKHHESAAATPDELRVGSFSVLCKCRIVVRFHPLCPKRAAAPWHTGAE